ncbi:MAG TPA: cation transporter [Bryobacteraceae bacterium]|nr:cation transporter [Bryobacteraceae bacterium]
MNAVGPDFDLPEEKQRALRRASRVCWASIGFLITIIAAIALTAGASQTMKAMWIEDALSIVPSASFLVGARFRGKAPNEAYPYGYRRAVLIGFLCGAVALFAFGIYLLGDSALKLIQAEHPTIQTVGLFGRRVWLGWLMIAALIYSVIPPLVLGRMKLPLSRELHDKVLHVSAHLDKGDWMSGIAAVLGILGLGYGLWWADAAAAAIISFEIIDDGWDNLRNSVAQLMDKRPSDIETGDEDPVIDKVQHALAQLDWVRDVRVRLREDGDIITGEAFIIPGDTADILRRVREASNIATAQDWRLHDVNIVLAPADE